jgi:AcrR family transcriptional regulator
MSPRPYDLGRRREAIDETRVKVLAAARELLVAPDGYARFTIDNVARIAGVARMTVYYRFKSKAGLLEALCDTLAMQSGMAGMMAEVFRHTQAQPALARFLLVLGHFYGTDRLLMRRLHGLSALDPEFEQVLSARNERRREGLRLLLKWCYSDRPEGWVEAKAALLHAITAFTVYDSLAGPAREPAEVAPLMLKLVQAAVDAD